MPAYGDKATGLDFRVVFSLYSFTRDSSNLVAQTDYISFSKYPREFSRKDVSFFIRQNVIMANFYSCGDGLRWRVCIMDIYYLRIILK